MCASASWVGLFWFFPFGWCRKGLTSDHAPMGRSLTSRYVDCVKEVKVPFSLALDVLL